MHAVTKVAFVNVTRKRRFLAERNARSRNKLTTYVSDRRLLLLYLRDTNGASVRVTDIGQSGCLTTAAVRGRKNARNGLSGVEARITSLI